MISNLLCNTYFRQKQYKIVYKMVLFKHVLQVLRLKIASNAQDLEESLKGLLVGKLKKLCAAMQVKKLGNKAKLIG